MSIFVFLVYIMFYISFDSTYTVKPSSLTKFVCKHLINEPIQVNEHLIEIKKFTMD